ncbi:MAG: type VI secretion system contractile sheath large subunit [Acidobacteriota bacterium]|nr:MAG: type VI secretion system contractile sheath large subunit [Acidobacteriota bacterium]
MLPTETDFEAQVSMETEAVPVPEDPPFHILFAGDYTGRANSLGASDEKLPVPVPIEIDRDNFEEVMGHSNVSLRIEPGGEGTGAVTLRFRGLDDFHPDSIFRTVPLFSDLRDLRKRLLDPAEYDAAAREVRSWVDDEAYSEPEAPREAAKAAPEQTVEGGDLLDDILGSAKRDADSYATQTTDKTELSRLVRELVKPHLVKTDEAEQAKLVAVIDGMTSDLMRKIVHHPEFKSLEAAWRGLYLVVRRVETASDLKLFLYDLSKEELTRDLKAVDDLTDSQYFRVAVKDAMESTRVESWALICGNYDFELNVEDTATLIRLAKISNVINAPFVSHIRPQMLGIESLAAHPTPADWDLAEDSEAGKLWAMLRTVPEAVNLGLAIPRFLVRLPYGEDTEPAEAFDFEELTEEGKHDQYLWANPSFVCGLVLAWGYRAFGWEIRGRYQLNVDGLPTHVYSEDGETKTKPCGEIAMTHEACDALLEQGLIPIISFKDTDRVRLGGVQSIAFPAKDLNGRWE